MTVMVCKNCGYRFESGISRTNKCPYCDGKSIEKEKNAEELLSEIDTE